MRIKKLHAVFLSVSALVLSAALSAASFADEPITENTAVNGPTVTFDKYLVMKENANVPNASFSFRVSAGSAAAASSEATEVLAGIKPDQVAVSDTAVFAPGDSTSSTVKD